MATKTLELVIRQTSPNNLSYYAYTPGERGRFKYTLCTRGYPTPEGVAGSLARIKRYAREAGYQLIDPATGREPEITLEQAEAIFWQTYELALGGRTWSVLIELLGYLPAEPKTVKQWRALFMTVRDALKAEAQRAA